MLSPFISSVAPINQFRMLIFQHIAKKPLQKIRISDILCPLSFDYNIPKGGVRYGKVL